jgi:hypothetical protein
VSDRNDVFHVGAEPDETKARRKENPKSRPVGYLYAG